MNTSLLLQLESLVIGQFCSHARAIIDRCRSASKDDHGIACEHFERCLQDEDYEFLLTLDSAPSPIPGHLTLTFTLTRDAQTTLYIEEIPSGWCHYNTMADFAGRLAGKVVYVDWPAGRFTIEVYVLELAIAQAMRMDA